MGIQVENGKLPGVRICTPDVHPDERGHFMEAYQEERYRGAGIGDRFVQDNLVRSSQGVLRGMHFQVERAQAKLIYVTHGEIFDVVVDLRRGSPAFGKWQGVRLSAKNRKQLYVPVGLAHGYCVLSAHADVIYKCSEIYYPLGERGLLWRDPGVGVEWPLSHPVLSPRDAKLPLLSEIDEDDLPVYKEA